MTIRQFRPYFLAATGALVVAAAAPYLRGPGRRPASTPHLPVAAAAVSAAPAVSVCPPADPNVNLALVESTILAQRKRIMGRKRSLDNVARVATEVGPVVRRALEMADLQPDLTALAAGAGIAVTDYKRTFAEKEEADLLLESGGDPNARSVSNAIGVAQFLAGTGRACGLKVNERAALPISRQMVGEEAKIDWLAGQGPAWGKPASAAANAPFWNRDQWISAHRAAWQHLEQQRRAVDERYDPARAIPVQTRYLVRLSRRYGSLAWAMQAYHGGEGGVAKTWSLFHCGPNGAPAYEELYRESTPGSHTDAFYYLYGRSDDHRYYWWKILMAERAIRLYRTDPAEFRRQWEALRPGYRMEVAWYGDPAPLSFADRAALERANADGTLAPIPPDLAQRGIRLLDVAPFDRGAAGDYKCLRPEGMGALLRLAAIYRGSGGHAPLDVLSLVQTLQTAAQWRQFHPAPRPPAVPGETVEEDPDFHPTGLVFDLGRPASDWDRRVLEYALGTLYDRLRITWQLEEGGPRRYHIVVNPTYRDEFRRQPGVRFARRSAPSGPARGAHRPA